MPLYEVLSIVTAAGSALAAGVAVWVSYKVHRSETLLAQRQLLLPLWQYISGLNEINSEKPITPDVIKSVNTLELVALCCEGQMIDPKVVKRTFSDVFITQFDQINRCGTLPGMTKNGNDILRECRAASYFYEELRREHLGRGQLSKGG